MRKTNHDQEVTQVAKDKVQEEKIRDKEWEPFLVVVMVDNNSKTMEQEEIKDKEIQGNK